MKDEAQRSTMQVLHPGIEAVASPAAAATAPNGKRVPRLSKAGGGLRGRKLAILDNGKVNAGEFLDAMARRLQREGLAEVRKWKKRHAGETGAAVIPGLLAWKPDLVLTALGD